jgi:hypothetical protein
MLYEISPEEEELVVTRAKERQANKEARNVVSKRFDPSKSDYQIHLEGMRAEFAAAKVLDANLNWELLVGGDNNNGDLSLKDGRTVSVKFRKREGWDFALQSENPNEFKEDIGVLVYPSNTHFRALNVCRWISREEFQQKSTKANYGYGPRLKISPTQMNPIKSLLVEISNP